APTGFIGMADRSLSVFLEQLGHRSPEPGGDAVEKGERRAQTDAQLLTDSAHRYSVPVMQKDHLGDQLIAEQASGQHAGRSRLDEAVTARAVFPLVSVNDTVGLEGATGRRGRGAKRSLFGLALAVVQLLLQAANFFLEMIDAALFLEAVRAEI